jgi:hypothetical protein
MVGAKIPVLEIENLFLKEDGRGLILYNDATNSVIQSASPWTGVNASGVTTVSISNDKRYFLPVASSMGWLKIHYISGSTYGPTGATAYIPIFRNLDTRLK